MRTGKKLKHLLVMMVCLYFMLMSIPNVLTQPSNKPAMCAGCDPTDPYYDAFAQQMLVKLMTTFLNGVILWKEGTPSRVAEQQEMLF